jgi:hypothetical protein
MLDSGAFTAWNAGKPVVLDEYIEFCKKQSRSDPALSEIICLDVIGDDRGSLKNANKMQRSGVDAMPVFHIGDDWGILKEYCDRWDKVGLSCRFGEAYTESFKFYDQCFARAWPHKFHSFGWVSERMLMQYPFKSSDASSWHLQPCGYGQWKEFGRIKLRGRVDIRSQVSWFLDLEQQVSEKWGSLFKKQGWSNRSDIRLACIGTPVEKDALSRERW